MSETWTNEILWSVERLSHVGHLELARSSVAQVAAVAGFEPTVAIRLIAATATMFIGNTGEGLCSLAR
jgi:hypothetical protein